MRTQGFSLSDRQRLSLRVESLLIVVALIMRFLPEPFTSLSYVAIAVYAIFGRRQAIEALLISWFLTMINPGLAPAAAFGSLGRYAVMAAAALGVMAASMSPTTKVAFRRPVLLTTLLGAFIGIHSLFVSPLVDVSVLRALSWTVATTTSLSAWLGMSPGERKRLAGNVFGGLSVLLVLSFGLLAHPIGYLRNGIGFQGLLNHPQAFGATIAILGAWCAAHALAEARTSRRILLLSALCVTAVILSEARVALIAMISGVMLAILIMVVRSREPLKKMLPGLLSLRTAASALAVIMGILLAWPYLYAGVGSFVAKRGDAQTIREAYILSRGALMDRMIVNIDENPVTGIGFGIASEQHTIQITRDAVLALPVAAAEEKGVTPIAVLEEMGIIGFLLVAAWIGMLIHVTLGNGVLPLAVLLVMLLLNLGEATLFSPGGLGLLTLALLGWCLAPTERGDL